MWKAYYYLIVIITLASLFGSGENDSIKGILATASSIITLIGLVGLHIYVFQMKKGTKLFWESIFWSNILISTLVIILILIPTPALSMLLSVESAAFIPKWALYFGLIVGFGLYLPMYIALYRLAYKKQVKVKKVPESRPFEDMAFVSFAMGIVGIFVPLLLSIPAALVGVRALEKIAKSNTRGRRMAWFSIILLAGQAVLFSASLVGLIALGFLYPSSPDGSSEVATGDQAVASMTRSQQDYLHKNVEKLTASTTQEEARLILGEPYAVILYRDELERELVFLCPDSAEDDECRIFVSFYDDKAYHITWENEGTFEYSKELEEKNLTI